MPVVSPLMRRTLKMLQLLSIATGINRISPNSRILILWAMRLLDSSPRRDHRASRIGSGPQSLAQSLPLPTQSLMLPPLPELGYGRTHNGLCWPSSSTSPSFGDTSWAQSTKTPAATNQTPKSSHNGEHTTRKRKASGGATFPS